MTDDSTLDTVNPVNLPTCKSRQWTYHKTTMSTCEHDRREHHGRALSARCNQWAHRARALCKHWHQGTCGTDSANHRTVGGDPCQGWSSPPSWAEEKYQNEGSEKGASEEAKRHVLTPFERAMKTLLANDNYFPSLIKLSDIDTGDAAAWHNPIAPLDIGFPT